MNRIAFLFPGQGSQSVGMGHDLYQEYDFVREIFDMAEEIGKTNISNLCFEGQMEELTKTVNLQPALTTVNLACLAAIEKQGITPNYSAGHSLGEYNALHASGVISKEDTLKLVYKRGKLMHRDATKNKGAMLAVIGLPIDKVWNIVAEVQQDGIVSIANHNTENQIVVTGAPEPVKKVASLAASYGAKSVPLKVSGAWHSALMKEAENDFKNFLEPIPFNTPQSGIMFNTTGGPAKDPHEIKSIMAKQLCSPVKWYDLVCRLREEKVEIFVEVGPGRVLSGMLKKILPKTYPSKTYNVNNMKTLEALLKDIT